MAEQKGTELIFRWRVHIAIAMPCTNAESNHLSWSLPEAAEDGELAHRIVIYRSETLPVEASEPSNIIDIISGDSTRYDDEPSENYFYAISVLDRLHNESSVVQISPSSIDNTHAPVSPILFSNFPNPFNSTTVIRYVLPEYSEVNVSIFDMRGRPVKNLVQSNTRSGEFSWDGSNDAGQFVSGGVYLCRLQTDHVQSSIKLVLLK